MSGELIIALISLFISTTIGIYTLFVSKRLRKSGVLNEIANQANLINESFGNSDILSPYGVKLGLKKGKEIKRYNKIVNIFFQHINLLNLVYSNQSYLGKVKEYERWINNEFRDWILSDKQLISTWYNFKGSKDMLNKSFVNWVDRHLDIKNELQIKNT